MTARFLPGLAAVLFLTAGCSSLPSMHSLLTFDQDEQPDETMAAAPAPVPVPAAAAQPDDWCTRVAANTRAQAAADGFDPATQNRMTQQSQRQCLEMGQRG